MNRHVLFTATVVLLAAIAVEPVAGQRRSRPRPTRSQPPAATKIPPAEPKQPSPPPDPRLVIPSKRTFNHNAKFSSEYDRFKDTTQVRFVSVISEPSEPRYRILGPTFRLDVGFIYQGQVLKSTPKDIYLSIIFYVYEGNRRYRDVFGYENDFIILFDGDRVSGKMPRQQYTDNAGGKYEVVLNLFDYWTFVKIANSKSVEMRVGNQEFKFTESHLESMRDLVSRTVP
jgi:hypothetical protein